MGSSAVVPPLPSGFSLDQPNAPSAIPPLPAGFSLDTPAAVSSPEGTTGPLGVLSGIGAGVFKTAQGAENLINKALPSSMQLPAIPAALTEQRTDAEKLGGGLETIGEFITGDEALKGLDLAGRLGLATKVAQIAQQSPRIAKAIEIGMNALRLGTVGAGQGAAQASAEGKPVAAGAEAGAAGGALGSAVGEGILAPGISKLGAGLEKVAPKFGNALLQANKVKNFQYGKNPGRVFLDENIPVKPWQSYEDVEKAIKDAGNNIKLEAHGLISRSPNANTKIPVGPQIHQIFDQALDDISHESGLDDREGLIRNVENLRKEMTENFDAKGNSTGQKGPMTPAQIAKLKTSIGRGTKWDPNKSPEAQTILNNLRKQVYSYLDSEVDKAVPGMAELNKRWANQIEAELIVKRRVAQEQAAAYGHSKGVSRSIIGAGVALMEHGDPLVGGALILNEAARMPSARIAIAKGASATGRAIKQSGAAGAAKALAPAIGAEAEESKDQEQ